MNDDIRNEYVILIVKKLNRGVGGSHAGNLDVDKNVTVKFVIKKCDINLIYLAPGRIHCGLV
jgi:hypothetical protein